MQSETKKKRERKKRERETKKRERKEKRLLIFINPNTDRGS